MQNVAINLISTLNNCLTRSEMAALTCGCTADRRSDAFGHVVPGSHYHLKGWYHCNARRATSSGAKQSADSAVCFSFFSLHIKKTASHIMILVGWLNWNFGLRLNCDVTCNIKARGPRITMRGRQKAYRRSIAGLCPQSTRHFAWQPAVRVSQTLRPSYLSHMTASAT